MNPSFYKSIHGQHENKSVPNRIGRFVKRHSIKAIVCFAFFILLFTSFLMMGTDASGKVPATASNEEQVVTVHSGDTLWAIAKRFSDSKHDIRYIIYRIKDRNELNTSEINPGQTLIIPSI